MATYGVTYYGTDHYGPDQPPQAELPPGLSVEPFTAQSIDYATIMVTWTMPTAGFADFRLLRSRYGFPVDENDGTILVDDNTYPGSQYMDSQVIPGTYHYYGIYLLVLVGAEYVWYRAGFACALAPFDYDSATWLLDRLPEYFKNNGGGELTTADNLGNPYLDQFMSLFGWGLDYLQTQLNITQNVNDAQLIPVNYLVNLAGTLGFPFYPEISAGTMRNALDNFGYLVRERGTVAGIEAIISQLTGWGADIRVGYNQMLEEDQSCFTDPDYAYWDISIDYDVGEIVSFIGTGGPALYECTAPSNRSVPPTNNLFWAVVDATGDSTTLANPATGWLNTWEPLSLAYPLDSPPAAALTETVGLPDNSQLAANPYFTGGSLTGWSATGNAALSTTSAPPTAGPFAWSAELMLNSGAGGAASSSFLVTAGETYTLSCWVLAPITATIAVGFTWLGIGGTQVGQSTSSVSIPLDVWTFCQESFVAAGTQAVVTLACTGPNALYVQAVTVNPQGQQQNALAITNTSVSPAILRLRSVSRIPADITAGDLYPDRAQVIGDGVPIAFTLPGQAWSSTVLYATNSVVTYEGMPFLALTASAGIIPPVNGIATSEWQPIGFDARIPVLLSGSVNGSSGAPVSPFIEWYDQTGDLITVQKARAPSPDAPAGLMYQSFALPAYWGLSLASSLPDIGSYSWTAAESTFTVNAFNNGSVTPSGSGVTIAVIDYGSPNVMAGVTIATLPADGYYAGLVLRYASAASYIRVDQEYIVAVESGAQTILAAHNTAFAAGDRMVASCAGTVITVYRNGTQVSAATTSVNVSQTSFGVIVDQLTALGTPEHLLPPTAIGATRDRRRRTGMVRHSTVTGKNATYAISNGRPQPEPTRMLPRRRPSRLAQYGSTVTGVNQVSPGLAGSIQPPGAQPRQRDRHRRAVNTSYQRVLSFPQMIQAVSSGSQPASGGTMTFDSRGGTLLLMGIRATGTSSSSLLSISSISDSALNNWAFATSSSSTSPPANGSYDSTVPQVGFSAIAYCIGADATTSITVAMNAQAAGSCLFEVAEFAYVSPSASAQSGNSAGSLASAVTSYATPSVTVSQWPAVIMATAASNGSLTAVSPPFILAGSDFAYAIVNAPGSYAATFTGSSQNVDSSAILVIG